MADGSRSLRFGSVCSGIEAASVAWHPLGWRAAWLAEIEPFPCAVLAHHFPAVPNLGDMTTIAARVRAGVVEAPDVLCGGTPCQAFSVAGKRGSLSDARGNLSLSFVELADAIDDVRADRGEPAAVVVWENVPGVLSTSDNAFGCFLAGLAGTDEPCDPGRDGWSNAGCVFGPRRVVCWRILDAQYFGLAQRRRRVFVVASARDGFDPVAVLLEFDGVRRDSAPRREAGEGTAGRAGGGTAFGGGRTSGSVEVAACLVAKGQKCDFEVETFVTAHTLRGEGFDASEDGTGRGTPLVPVSVALRGREGGATAELGDDCAFTLRASDGGGDKAHVLAFAQNQRDEVRMMDVAGALAAEPGAKQQTYAQQGMAVRRLTPRECERLQGFPDDYTLIPWRKRDASECPDGPRYKALGNSWAVPCAAWIGQRIDEALQALASNREAA